MPRFWHRGAAQADAGAQAVQIFDSWASELAPQDFDVFSGPYIQRIIDSVRQSHPDLQLILYISGSGGLMERMAACKPDIISVDQRVDMRDALRRIGPDFAVQVPLSPCPSSEPSTCQNGATGRHDYELTLGCVFRTALPLVHTLPRCLPTVTPTLLLYHG